MTAVVWDRMRHFTIAEKLGIPGVSAFIRPVAAEIRTEFGIGIALLGFHARVMNFAEMPKSVGKTDCYLGRKRSNGFWSLLVLGG